MLSSTNVVTAEPSRLLKNINKQLQALRNKSRQQDALRNLTESVVANTRELEITLNLNGLIKSCKDLLRDEPLMGCQVFEMMLDIDFVEAYSKRLIMKALIECVCEVKNTEVLAEVHNKLQGLILRCIALSTVLPQDILEGIVYDCIAWLSTATIEPSRRYFAVTFLSKLIELEPTVSRSFKSLRGLTILLLWDITQRSIMTMRGLAIAVADLAVWMAGILIEFSPNLFRDFRNKVIEGLRTEDRQRQACAFLMLGRLITQDETADSQFFSFCSQAARDYNWALHDESTIDNNNNYSTPWKAKGINDGYFDTLGVLMVLNKEQPQEVQSLFSKLLEAVVPQSEMISGSGLKQITFSDRSAALRNLTVSLPVWYSLPSVELLLIKLSSIIITCDASCASDDSELFVLIKALLTHYPHHIQAIIDILHMIRISTTYETPQGHVDPNSNESEHSLLNLKVALQIIRNILGIIYNINDMSLLNIALPVDEILTNLTFESPESILSEALTISSFRRHQIQLDFMIDLLRHQSVTVRFAAAAAVITLCVAQKRTSESTSTRQAEAAVRLDSNLVRVIEVLLDIAVADMVASLRLHILKLLSNNDLDSYLSLPDNIASLFMAFNDVEANCSEAALMLLCRLLPCHRASVHQDLQKIQEDLLKDVEDHNHVSVVLSSTRKLKVMFDRFSVIGNPLEVERIVNEKLLKSSTCPMTNSLAVALLELQASCLRIAGTSHEDFYSTAKALMHMVKTRKSADVKLAAMTTMSELLRANGEKHLSYPDVHQTIVDIIKDDVNEVERIRRAACAVNGVFGALDPVRLRSMQRHATEEAVIATHTEPLAVIRPLTRTHPKLSERFPSVTLYLLVKFMQEVDVSAQSEALKCIADMFKEALPHQVEALVPHFIPLLREKLASEEGLDELILKIIIILCPSMRKNPTDGAELLKTMSEYCNTVIATSPPISTLIVNILDELARVLPSGEMQQHRWAIDFIMMRLANDMEDEELVLRVIRSLESFASFMKDKDLRHVVPQVLQCLSTLQKDNSYVQLISISCLEFINLIILKHHLLARDLCALIVHSLMEFVVYRTEVIVCDAAMATLVSLLASVDKVGKRFMDLVVRMGRQNKAIQISENFNTILRAYENNEPLSEPKVKLPPYTQRNDINVGNQQITVVSELSDLTERAFINELWNMRISPQHVQLLNMQHSGKNSIIDFKFIANQDGDRRLQEFLRRANDPNSSLRVNLRLTEIKQKVQVPRMVDLRFLEVVRQPPQTFARKRESKWMEWLQSVCVAMLECSPYSSLSVLSSIALKNIEVATMSLPFSVNAILAKVDCQTQLEFTQMISKVLDDCPREVRRVLFDLAEFMEGERGLKKNGQQKNFSQITCVVVRPNQESKFGINYDQDNNGIVVTRLAPDGPGAAANVPVGGILQSINNEKVRAVTEIPNMIKGKTEIKLVLSVPVKETDVDSKFLDLKKLANVSVKFQMHARAIYFNEQLFQCQCNSILGLAAANGGSANYSPVRPRESIQAALLNSVETLIARFQHLGLTMEAKGIVNFIGDRLSERITPERFGFDKAGTLEQLNWWSNALSMYEERMLTDENSLLGAVRCWDALGEMHSIIDTTQSRVDLSRSTLSYLEPYRANAAFVLGEWTILDSIDIRPDSRVGAIPKAAVLFRQNRIEEATTVIKEAREDMFERFTDSFAESYVRAYDLLVEQQHLNHFLEVIDYRTATEERRTMLRGLWATRLRQMSPKPQHWRTALAINSLVLTQEEDITSRLECVQQSNKIQVHSLAQHILLKLLETDDIHDNKNWNTRNPLLLATYAQHRYVSCTNEVDRTSVYNTLLNTINAISVQPTSPNAGAWGDCWLQLGEWSTMHVGDPHITISFLNHATTLNPNNARAFHYLGRAQQALGKDGSGQLVGEAINALFRAVQLSGNKSIVTQDILRILSIWFAHGASADVIAAMEKGIITTDHSVWLRVTPQLVARMGISSRSVRMMLTNLLIKVGESFPHALIYPLALSEKSSSASKKEVALEALKGIEKSNEELVKAASQINHELVRIAILWHEQWIEGIRCAAKFGSDCNETIRALNPLMQIIEHPMTPNENQFVATYRPVIVSMWANLHRKEDGIAWTALRKLYGQLNKAIANERKLNLKDVSPILYEMRNSPVAVPGTFHPSKPLIRVTSFVPRVTVMTSKQKPRRFGLIGSDGVTYRFLLKGHEDLRQDERVMQFIELVNSIFSNDATSIEHGYAIPRYSVIPLTDNVGIIGWVENTETVFRMLEQRRQDYDISIYLEVQMIVTKGCLSNADDYHKQSKEKRKSLLKYVMDNTSNNELMRIFWERNSSCESWLDYRKQYVQTLALMSMVGYVLGLGDRHLNNLMIQNGGYLVHIDFGDCFEVAMHRQSFAEAVPFRLTRLMIAALGVTDIEGAFRITCENTMRLMRRSKENLITLLEAFIYDPLINWNETGGKAEEGDNDNSRHLVTVDGETATQQLSVSLSTRKQLMSSALLTEEWTILKEYIKNGGANARRSAPLPKNGENVLLPEAIDHVIKAVREREFPTANAWLAHIQALAPDVAVENVFEHSVTERRNLAADKALNRVQAKLNGTDFPNTEPTQRNYPASGDQSFVRSSEDSVDVDDDTRWDTSPILNIVNTSFRFNFGGNLPLRPLTVHNQVVNIITEATSLDNLAEAYITGWAPFW